MSDVKETVRQRLARGLWEECGPLAGLSPKETKEFYEKAGETSRRLMGEHARRYVAAITNACISTGHRGSVAPRDGRVGLACVRCQGRTKAMLEIVELIEPDRA